MSHLNLQLEENQSITLADASGKVLFSYPENALPGNSEIEDFVEAHVLQSPIYQNANKAVDQFRGFCETSDEVVVPPFKNSSFSYEVVLDRTILLGELQVPVNSNKSYLKCFVQAVSLGIVDIYVDKSNDILFKLFDIDIDEDSCDKINDKAWKVRSNFSSNTVTKKFFQHVYESDSMHEFRQLFENMLDKCSDFYRNRSARYDALVREYFDIVRDGHVEDLVYKVLDQIYCCHIDDWPSVDD